MDNFSSTYNTYYQSNAATIYIYKSSRKNSKILKSVNINHLINNKEDRKVSDDHILSQFVGTIESIVCYAKQHKHLELSTYADIFKQADFINANNEIYHDTEPQRFYNQRVKFSSIEDCINYVFFVYTLIYPYNKLSIKTIHNDSSIRYLINQYYH